MAKNRIKKKRKITKNSNDLSLIQYIKGTNILYEDFIDFITKDRSIDETIPDEIIEDYLKCLDDEGNEEKKEKYKKWIRLLYNDIRIEYPIFTNTVKKHKELIHTAWIHKIGHEFFMALMEDD